MNSSDRDKLGDECRELMERFKTLILATVSPDGLPDASTTPYLLHEGSLFVFVSELAKHTGHMLHTGRCVALFLEDEANSVNMFARKRLTIECKAAAVDRQAERAATILDRMGERFDRY